MKETLGSSVTEFIAQDKKNYATEGAPKQILSQSSIKSKAALLKL